MPESGPYGSERGVPGNGHPYRDLHRSLHLRCAPPSRSMNSLWHSGRNEFQRRLMLCAVDWGRPAVLAPRNASLRLSA